MAGLVNFLWLELCKTVNRCRSTEVLTQSPSVLAHFTGEFHFSIPISRLRYKGGLAYSSIQHHFVRYYSEGRKALDEFYARHCPRNLFEMHFLPSPVGNPPSTATLPWVKAIHRIRLGKRGERGLRLDHGIQHFGPASRRKVELEARRLDKLRSSIARHGFVSAVSGFPRGYFLVNPAGDWRFLITGGQHRVAALTALGADQVKVRFQPNFPRLVDARHWANWPLVQNGDIEGEHAVSVLQSYFRDESTRLW